MTSTLLVLASLAVAREAAAVEAPLGCPNPFEWRVVELVNAERVARGLPLLGVDVRLTEAAQRHSDDMAANDFIGHTGSDGSDMVDRIEAAGYLGWTRLAENVAAGYSTPESVVSAWLASPGHRANLLDAQVAHLGVGYAQRAGTRYRHYWTQDFGRTRSAPAAPIDHCPACANGVDDDGDGLLDWDGGGLGAPDPECADDPQRPEQPPACGLGAEIAAVLLGIAALRQRSGLRRRA